MPDLQLPEEDAGVVALALDVALRANARNGVRAGAWTRRFAAMVAAAVPEIAVRLPDLLNAAGPQAAARVKAEARRLAASRVASGVAGWAGSNTAALLSSGSAARIADVTGQAIRQPAPPGGWWRSRAR
jgi:hypothetical protein